MKEWNALLRLALIFKIVRNKLFFQQVLIFVLRIEENFWAKVGGSKNR
jgi:hypothetical protein